MNNEQELARPKEIGIGQHIVGHIIIAIVLVFIFGLAVKWLWNGLLPGLFGVKLIGYWQGIGLVILARLLFGSFGFGLGHHPHAPFRQQYLSPRHARGEWAHYNAWWQAEGQQAFAAYLARKAQPTSGQDTSETE